MPSDTDNSRPTIAWNSREIPIASRPRSRNDNFRQGDPLNQRIANSRGESSPPRPARLDIERLLLWLDPHLREEDFPIAIQFITHGLRTTVIFEHAPSRDTCGPNLPHSHEPEKQN